MYNQAMTLVENQLRSLRKRTRRANFDLKKPAEIEVNEFYLSGETVRRVMIVLRTNGCEAYKRNFGCSMCAHCEGTPRVHVTHENYLAQWQSVLDGSAIKSQDSKRFSLGDYPILCLYNLGSLLNSREIPLRSVREIFRSLNAFPALRKVIIESRPEFVTSSVLENIRQVYSGVVEVGMGLESSNSLIRELCHHKNMPDLGVFIRAIHNLHSQGFLALAYVNQKPPFLTEQEALEDAVKTSLYAFDVGADAVSIEPTSLQNNSLVSFLNERGLYRVPWLWSVREVAFGVYSSLARYGKTPNLRLGGYFDEEILSGSQGVAAGVTRNELFPYKTAGNCSSCDPQFIQEIKRFNSTNRLDRLLSIPECPSCFQDWRRDLSIRDPRDIPRRIVEILGSVEVQK